VEELLEGTTKVDSLGAGFFGFFLVLVFRIRFQEKLKQIEGGNGSRNDLVALLDLEEIEFGTFTFADDYREKISQTGSFIA
jgi:hypothetical protein